jgi:hypothetical protein
VKLQLLSIIHVECCELSNISVITAVAIIRVNMLMMATAVFAKTDNFQHSMRFMPKCQIFMMNSRHGNLRTRITVVFNMYSLKVQGMA